jgi:hypothetical protein
LRIVKSTVSGGLSGFSIGNLITKPQPTTSHSDPRWPGSWPYREPVQLEFDFD